MLQTDVAPGVHRIEDAYTNWYLLEDGDRLTIVDTGVPDSWDSLTSALSKLGRSPADVAAVVLTDAHFAHGGFA
jgi:glyoxylase-like metal-dependent hydrolase (beta-lactamase superfamily II)